ncbi:MAG: MBOAT family O-acyltransferase, partial [Bacteroidota bacterium]
LFVAFFPQLVAGPIERASNLLPQFRREVRFDYHRVSSGLRLALWGFVKKVVIADRLAMFVDVVYNSPGEHHGWTIVLATWMFAFQIFCDFSGYSDIAIGIARMLGFDLMKNFDRPYFATSLQDFWRRWHISLSTWFRDYVYIPLGGNRVIKWRWYYNLFLTFLISGLWHGAAWTFVIWGALHGGGIVLELMLRRGNQPTIMNGWQRVSKIAFIFGVVCLAWLFFRANSLSDAVMLLGNMTDFSLDQLSLNMILDSPYDLVVGIGSVLLLLGVHLFQEKHHVGIWIITQPSWVRWIIYLGLVLLILNFGEFNQQQFIYFQF